MGRDSSQDFGRDDFGRDKFNLTVVVVPSFLKHTASANQSLTGGSRTNPF